MHIGFIADGNRRWARSHGLPVLEGHKKGLDVIEMTIGELLGSEVDFVSFYVFSTENWSRSSEEVGNLMKLAGHEIVRLAKKMAKNNVKCLIVGSRQGLPGDLAAKFAEAEKLTENCTGLTACFCFNYGGQQEIVDAARQLATEAVQNHWSAEQISENLTPETFSRYLYNPEIPPLDMIVRTSGEERISGFMLWRAAYSEFLFLKKYYPELTHEDIRSVLAEYQKRNRRYGK